VQGYFVGRPAPIVQYAALVSKACDVRMAG
jgi:EAL domain-containing protein (putative c-di-GMP-specific phosphodiesterase class I)